MEIGEMISLDVGASDEHSELTCPWHAKAEREHTKLAPADKEEDVPPPGLPRNDGGTLGGNLGGMPKDLTVTVRFVEAEARIVNVKGKNKEIAEYVADGTDHTYNVVFSAHHIIPGNEALKGHPVLRWVGGTPSLGQYADGVSSELADGEFIGYDINAAVNGVWLPGPYALSTKGKWTDKKFASPTTVSFKQAYALAVMDRMGRQFHYRHTDYSDFVAGCLDKVDTRLEAFAKECPIVNPKQKPDKPYKAPYGLVAKFDRISNRLRPLLDGTRWSPHIYTDNDAGPPYIAAARRRLRVL